MNERRTIGFSFILFVMMRKKKICDKLNDYFANYLMLMQFKNVPKKVENDDKKYNLTI